MTLRPWDLETIVTYADDNYLGSENANIILAKQEIKRKINVITKWLTGSGLKINDQKTEICIFHRKELIKEEIEINNIKLETTNQMNILGMIFDSNLSWDHQYNNAIKEANHNLYQESPLRSLPNYA